MCFAPSCSYEARMRSQPRGINFGFHQLSELRPGIKPQNFNDAKNNNVEFTFRNGRTSPVLCHSTVYEICNYRERTQTMVYRFAFTQRPNFSKPALPS